MRSFEIVAHAPQASNENTLRAPRSTTRAVRAKPAREVIDMFVRGANVTALVREVPVACIVRDLGVALASLASRAHGKEFVRFYDEPWELCVERFGSLASLSVYRSGLDPLVAVYDRLLPFDDVVGAAADAIVHELSQPHADALLLELARAHEAVVALRDASKGWGTETPPSPVPTQVEVDRDALVSFGADFAVRQGALEDGTGPTERTDLHALLFRGKIRAVVRGKAFELSEGHPFVFAERLLDASRKALFAWEKGTAYNARAEAGGVLVGLRLSPATSEPGKKGWVALTFGVPSRGADTQQTYPAIALTEVLEATLSFGRALVRTLLRHDKTQAQNLRLSAFRRALREATSELRDLNRNDGKVNPAPESYRAYAEAIRGAEPRSPSLSGSKLRYAAKWHALVPGMDLRATFLCGDRILIGGAREMLALDRVTGTVLWRRPTERATHVVTPAGLARILSDGLIEVHDYATGEIALRTKITAPRPAPAGAIVNLPGLPRLLVVTEGERHLVAIDLGSGEPVWRVPWAHKSSERPPRLKRVGRLLYASGADGSLTALDVQSGKVVWRTRSRLRFTLPILCDHECLFALAGGTGTLGEMFAIDPYSGDVRWSRVLLPAACVADGAPLLTSKTVVTPLRHREGLRLVGMNRTSGDVVWSTMPVAPPQTSWLSVDDLLIGNTPTGELVAVDGTSGALRYRRVLGKVSEVDLPRKLEPVLRSGALFVPHVDVHVVRPETGDDIGSISKLGIIPDLLRVDERNTVFVAEESGHLAAHAALPQLTLVK